VSQSLSDRFRLLKREALPSFLPNRSLPSSFLPRIHPVFQFVPKNKTKKQKRFLLPSFLPKPSIHPSIHPRLEDKNGDPNNNPPLSLTSPPSPHLTLNVKMSIPKQTNKQTNRPTNQQMQDDQDAPSLFVNEDSAMSGVLGKYVSSRGKT
jgi:hypothetical protein